MYIGYKATVLSEDGAELEVISSDVKAALQAGWWTCLTEALQDMVITRANAMAASDAPHVSAKFYLEPANADAFIINAFVATDDVKNVSTLMLGILRAFQAAFPCADSAGS